MHIKTLIKYLMLAWGLPIAIVLKVRTFTPEPSLSRSDFSSQSFKPSRVWVAKKIGTKGSDYFELRIESPNGDQFFHRAPEREPIIDLHRRFPKDAEVKILYSSEGREENVLMEIVTAEPLSAIPVLSFEDIMKDYAFRRRVVYIVAAVWCVLVNLLSFALWKVDVSGSTSHQNNQGEAAAAIRPPTQI